MITAGSAAGQSASGKLDVVVEAFYDALSSGDCSRVKQLLTPDFAAVFTGEGFYSGGVLKVSVLLSRTMRKLWSLCVSRGRSCRGPKFNLTKKSGSWLIFDMVIPA